MRVHTMSPLKLKRAEEFILGNLESDMSLQNIADAAGMSMFHFTRVFAELVGMPPHQYLLRARLKAARAMLHECDAMICLNVPAEFHAVGRFFDDFNQVTDDDVVAILKQAVEGVSAVG